MKNIAHKELDGYECAILDVLQRDGRATNQEIAERVGLSPSPCWRRIRALEADGYITRYTALLDRRKLSFEECYFTIVTLRRHQQGVVEAFEQAIVRHPQVLECHAVTGDGDYLLKVLASSNSAYHRFMEEGILSIDGVANVRTTISLREVKSDTAIPVNPPPLGAA